MKWIIDKEFTFEAGHRVWAQKLEHENLSLTTDCACKHLHGHSYTVKVHVGSDNLNESGMVTDFKNLNFFKKFLDDVLDHKFIIDVNDPLFGYITGVALDSYGKIDNFTNLGTLLSKSNPSWSNDLIDSFVLVNFIPTSENICKHLKFYASSQLVGVATVTSVELWETKKSHCVYYG
jgi:6-pyruvoyltetrahydropterin/6-carboxytetrahydropterin synthase